MADTTRLVLGKNSHYKMAYQLYSVNNDMQENSVTTLKALKTMGYQDFEIYGFDAEKNSYYGYGSSHFKSILNDLDLTVSSGHYGFSPFLAKPVDQLMRFVDQCIAAALVINSRYINWPWLAPEQRDLKPN